MEGPPLKWNPDISTAWRDAKQTHKKLLLYFFSEDAFLDHYEKGLWTDASVQAFLDTGYVPVRIDMKKNTELAQKLGVFRAGTVAVYNGDGAPLGVINDPLPKDQFLKELQSFQ
jgi:thioredoxin-related protein